ncbi:MAG: hypothetical protein IJJ06_09545 [Mogibacterium sp.]|nr:hypothetical protein [Mogibacterium sp.]
MQVKRKLRILSILMCLALLVSFSFTMVLAEDGEESAAKKIVSSASADSEDESVKSLPEEDSADETAVVRNELKTAGKDSFFIDGEPGYEDDYIDWNGDDDFILYKGDVLNLDFFMHDAWEEYNTIPAFDIWSLKYDEPVFTYNPADSSLVAAAGEWDHYTAQIDIGSADLEPGYYFIAIQAMPCNEEGAWVEDFSGFEIPEEYVDFTINERP